MSDPDLSELRKRAEQGDSDAVGVLVELAGERGDFDELRRLADEGSRDAADVLVELAGERGDRDELRRLASGGNQDALDVLDELDGSRRPTMERNNAQLNWGWIRRSARSRFGVRGQSVAVFGVAVFTPPVQSHERLCIRRTRTVSRSRLEE